MYELRYTDELYHHGVKGQKWGIRRYQNPDGSYKSGAEGRYDDLVKQYGKTKGEYVSKAYDYNSKISKKDETEYITKNRKKYDQKFDINAMDEMILSKTESHKTYSKMLRELKNDQNSPVYKNVDTILKRIENTSVSDLMKMYEKYGNMYDPSSKRWDSKK